MSNSTDSPKRVYRQSALQQLQSPESTDSLMRVVGPSGWVVALAIALVFCGAIYWSIFGAVTTFVAGKGVLGPAYGETRDFVATHSGILQSLPVKLGDTIEEGELLASIEIVSVAQDKREAERTLRSLKDEQTLLETYWNTLLPQRMADLEQKEKDLARQIEWDQKQVESREKILQGFEQASSDGAITPLRLEQARDAFIQASGNLDETKFDKDQLAANRLELENQKTTAFQAMNDRVLQAQESLADLEDTLDSGGKVLSDMSGRVVAVDASIGSFVQPGSPIVTVQPVNDDIEGVFFANPLHGKKVLAGMDVNVSPSTVEASRFGTIRGKVVWVSEDPQSDTAVARQLGNETLAKALAGNEPPIAFGVQLEKDKGSPSGLKWTSGHGPNMKVRTGTLADADVAVEQVPPIVLVIPAIRRVLGLDQ
ncbi:NHLP bacteriocin system secretion protein [Martelella soudanensis]|uniref:NHLP bacteriocin system secretion protein n=1 Tax=unclassified Martelella TaxID=2629616 RepID=UPI0015DE0295|nr:MULTISPECIES: NHLP bacteriocin system secretion protein [unclassified Martelella]